MKYLEIQRLMRPFSNSSLQSDSKLRKLSFHSLHQTVVRKVIAPPHYRSFHQCISRPIYYEASQATYDLFQSIHSISGTSWSITIPLIALLVRMTVSLPLSLIQQRASCQQVKLIPILLAWKHNFRKETLHESGEQGPKACEKIISMKMRRKRNELFRRYNCGRWKLLLGFFQIPIFLGVLDVFRRMTDTKLTSFAQIFSVENMSDSQRIMLLEPNLANEGMLWFPNLMVADPHLALPFILSGTFMLNIFASGKSHLTLSRRQIVIRRGLGVAALCIGPLFLHVPSALLLYWISNSLLNWIQSWLVSWLIPISQPMQPLIPKKPWKITGLEEKELKFEKNPFL
ncbi:Cytochrome c oxidase assembly protein COX18, mitochondrial [Erysiphe neolycopersici]|uniref:Cytochrome c oxidase assembly protein COX18, mitochondrial n=1 Tax=Erysiphe neolycopersici TaxID=212602 RepID=A0A420HS06_9PEZI|nr:Cytochrome c oxidase assembly protein COX18, mitochondrial [Erysiphe neolycopersici]